MPEPASPTATAGPPLRSLASFLVSVRGLASIGRDLGRLLAALGVDWRWLRGRRAARPDDEAETADLLARAEAARAADRRDEAASLFRDVLGRQRSHVGALRGLRDLAAGARHWPEALEAEERLVGLVPPTERAVEAEWLAAIHYELGRQALAARRVDAALARFKQAVRADRHFVPASVALGDACEAAGDAREAVRVWERAAELTPSLPLLARLERAYREEGRPSRMIALYRAAAGRAPDDLAIALALGRVYLELEMLDEAADQFEKVEVRAPALPVVHAFLGAVFERRGDAREALEEYRRALRLGQAFTWPHECRHCGVPASAWDDRCRACGRWNSLRPADGR